MTETEKENLVKDGAIDVTEAQRLTGLGRTYLYSLMDSGRIKFCKVGKRRLLLRSEITKLLAESLVSR